MSEFKALIEGGVNLNALMTAYFARRKAAKADRFSSMIGSLLRLPSLLGKKTPIF